MQQTSFFANYDYHPRLDTFDFSKDKNPMAKDLANRLSKLHSLIKIELKEAQEQQKINMDAYQKEPQQFNVSEKVWLLYCNIKSTCPCNKLDYCRLRPFLIYPQIKLIVHKL